MRETAWAYTWSGYKRIAVVCRRSGLSVSNRFVYRVLEEADLLKRRRPRSAELYQAARLFELLPEGPNELWHPVAHAGFGERHCGDLHGS